FRAKHWCTLCVGVQTTLWLLFFCYLGGGFFRDMFPWRPEGCVLLAAYVFAVLGLNAVLSTLRKLPCHEKDS
ncbi:MAG: hypothetical protein HDQ93_06110, partial [Desulfovibrio sp.]|nr:hypothetical protein [Desulfovibrio sp.]